MTDRQWQEAWGIFRTARDLPEDERRAFLASLDTDPGVMEEVVAMLDEPAEQSMPQPPSRVGTRFGRYEIVGMLGSGGMGQVYAARDPELGRRVAIKLLAPDLAASRPAVERLIREARAASALNHPHIVTVYEVIRAADDVGIAMEFVEGASLRSFCGKPEQIANVTQWGCQIARALAAAHQRNIIHRDIKPENLMVRQDGILKVLDFGLARYVELDGETRSAPSSSMLAGTLNYMAPEQTRMEPTTSASDVFSLGLVLYELATGRHPFRVASPIDTAHAIAHAQPKLPSSVIRGIPPGLDALLRDMLEKDPAKRPSATEVDHRLSGIPAIGSEKTSPRARWLAASIVLCLLTAAAGWLLRDRSAMRTERITRLTTALPGTAKALKITPFTSLEGNETDPSFSPDGRSIAFTWTRDGSSSIYIKPIDPGEPRRLTSDGTDTNPAWSPDGRLIAFLRGPATGKVAVMTTPAEGGVERQVGDIEDTLGYPGPIAWMADGKSLIVRDAGPLGPELYQLSLATGEKRALTLSKLGGRFAPSPDGRQLAFERATASDRVKICVLALGVNSEKCLAETFHDTYMAWSADSRSLLLTNQLGLWRQSVAGGPITKLADGKFEGLVSDLQGRRLAFWQRYSDLNIWRIGTDGAPAVRLIASSREDSEPEYSPDGSKILFRSNRSGNFELWICSKDGSNPVQITSLRGHLGSGRWSPDGRQIVFDAMTPNDKNVGIWLTPPASGATRRLTPPEMAADVPGWSRDGRWVYFTRDSGVWKIPVSGGSPEQITDDGALDVTESRDSRFLYFRKERSTPGIWRSPASGGQSVIVSGTDMTFSRYWQLVKDGIYFVDASGQSAALKYLDLTVNRIREVAALGTGLIIGPRGLAVSPDGHWILFTKEDLTFSDIMLVENFQ